MQQHQGSLARSSIKVTFFHVLFSGIELNQNKLFFAYFYQARVLTLPDAA
ncbi:hypothetical protein [Photobacterium sanguinicancri]|nr:hypothetical protein [Photobacterium sanguinicancri]MDO6498119.1 hypothetical protein [Photobacterium sanguinicancri]